MSFQGIERILHLKHKGQIKEVPLRIHYPTYLPDRGYWQTNVEFELVGKGVCGIGSGDDALQSLLFAISTLKKLTDGRIESGEDWYWLFEGDRCGWFGI